MIQEFCTYSCQIIQLKTSPTNCIFLTKFNSKFSCVVVWFTDGSSEPLEITAKTQIYNQVIFKTTMLKSSLYNCSDAHILEKWSIAIVRPGVDAAIRTQDKNNKQVIFKKWTLFIDFTSEINHARVDHAEDLVAGQCRDVGMQGCRDVPGQCRNVWITIQIIRNNRAILQF